MPDQKDIDQEDALLALMKIECKIDDGGCDGPWCSARAAVAKAFDMEDELHREEEEEAEGDDEAQG